MCRNPDPYAPMGPRPPFPLTAVFTLILVPPEELCLQKGAVVVLRKPLTAEKVLQVVDACCEQREGAAVGAGAAAGATPPPSEGEGHSPLRDLPPVSRESLAVERERQITLDGC